MNNIINYKEYIKDTVVAKKDYIDDSHQVELLLEIMATASESFNVAKDKYNSDVHEQSRINAMLKSENEAIRKENNHMKRLLTDCIPMHTIVFLIINAVIIAVSVTLLVLCYGMKLYIIKPYYLICALIICFTLFGTAIRSLYDWRKMLNE